MNGFSMAKWHHSGMNTAAPDSPASSPSPAAVDRYAVIGHPIGHSLSPRIHALFARATGQALVYEAIDGGSQPGGFEAAVAAFAADGGRGLNVTLPFKLRALALADAASADARLAGAANALRLQEGRIEAHNFDGLGLVRDITGHLAFPLQGAHVLLLGAGGATRGALLPLARAGAARLTIANRTPEKAHALACELAPHLPCPLHAIGLHELPAAADVVINATSAALAGQAPAAPPDALAATLGRARLAYDMVYGLGAQFSTPFMQAARQADCPQVADGLGMLLEQAAASFEWWRGLRPDTAAARAELRAV